MADHAHHDDHPPARPLARLRALLRPERRDTVSLVVYAFAVAVLSLATPIAVEALVNTVSFGVLMWPVIALAGVLFGCLTLAAALRAVQVYVIECLQRRLFVRVVADYAHRLPRVSMDALDSRHGPELANRFFDVLTVQKSLASLLLDGIAIVVTAVVGMVVLAFYHPFLLGFDILLMLAVVVLLFGFGVGGVRTALHESHVKYDVANWLEELLRDHRALQFAGGRHLALEKADELAHEYVTARKAHFAVVWRQTVFALALQVVASTALLGLGGWLVVNQQLTLGQLVASELIVTLVVASLAKLGKYAESFYDLMASAEKLGMLTDLPLERSGGEALPVKDAGMAIRVRGLHHVGGRPVSVPDFAAAPGDRVAVVGPLGSGKTTLIEVLAGLRDPAGGVVLLDGVDLRGLDPARLRDQVALVGENDLFAGSVLDNVRVGRPHLTPADVREALQTVNLLAKVHDLPNGLDTVLPPSGGPMAGSRAVRLGIARAIVGRPRLLILDGVLDGLDPRDCPDLFPALFDRPSPWTLVVVTRDPDIIDRCDQTVTVGPNEPVDLQPAGGHH
jgi:ABC-type bacteriocin/lantibiotic exporter with double-glycine peptidase domain